MWDVAKLPDLVREIHIDKHITATCTGLRTITHGAVSHDVLIG